MLALKNISVKFNCGSPVEREVIKNLNLNVAAGEFVTIIGGNGAGKSTLFNIISGEHIADNGSVHIANQDYTRWPSYKRAVDIAKVIQDPKAATIAEMTIEENMAAALLRAGRRKLLPCINKQRQILFQEKLNVLNIGLEHRLKDLTGTLSGGQRQALSLVMATLASAKLLLLDEHTAALDPKMADKVMEMTETIVRQSQLTTLMITHNMSHALKYGDRTILLHDGKILKELSREEKALLKPCDLAAIFDEI